MFGYFYLNSLTYQAWIAGLIVVFTLLLIIINVEQLFDPMSIVRIDLEEEECSGFNSKVSKDKFSQEDFNRWREEYTHPLLIGATGSTINDFNNRVMRLEDFEAKTQQYDYESEDQQQSDRPTDRGNEAVESSEETKSDNLV
jgi:hypothetical protein